MNTNETLFEAAACRPETDGQHVGAQLFAARTAGGHALEDIAATLNIRIDHLRALEEGWWDELPSQAYAVGFLKTYARFLGLNVGDIVARYRAENGHLAGSLAAPCRRLSPQPIEESRIPKTPIVIMSAFLALAGYCGWYFVEGSAYVAADSASAIPAHLAAFATPEAGGTGGMADAPPPEAPAPAVQLSAIEVKADRKIAMVTAPKRPLKALVVAEAAAASIPAVSEAVESERSHMSALARLGAPALIRPANAGVETAVEGSRITLRAKTDTWILVEDGKDTAVRQGVLRAGEQYRAPDIEGLTLTTSNLDGLEVIVDGMVKSFRANGGAIARDLPLDVERLAAL